MSNAKLRHSLTRVKGRRLLDVGEDFTMDVARRYGHPNLDLLKTKLEFFATADFVDTIIHGDGRAQECQQELAWSRLRER